MHINTFKAELKRALPDGHPLVDKVDEIEGYDAPAFESVVDIIEDWTRGIRDWSEVDRVIQLQKDKLCDSFPSQ